MKKLVIREREVCALQHLYLKLYLGTDIFHSTTCGSVILLPFKDKTSY
jgi:hypothetical protein